MPAEPSAKGTRRSLLIGPYAVVSPLTLGSLGSGYRATDANGGRTVALKVLPPELVGNAAARERFQREAKNARKVRSPNVVNVLDFGDASGTWYLALELVEGPTLAEHVQRHGALDGEAGRDVIVQAARALALLHKEGLVPRDLSADNFRVCAGPDAKGRIGVKLLDIGLLRPPEEETPGDVRAALAALGETGRFLLTGRPGGRLDFAALGGDVSEDFRGVLRRLLGQRAEERYATPSALVEALGEDEPVSEEPEEPVEAVEEAPAVDPLAALAAPGDDKPPARKASAPQKPPRRRDEEAEDEPPPSRTPKEGEGAKDEAEPAPRRRPAPAGAKSHKALIWGGVAFAVVLTVGVVLYLTVFSPPNNSAQTANRPTNLNPVADRGDKPQPIDPGKEKPPETKKEPDPEKPKEQPQQPGVPWLYEAKQPIAWDKLRPEYLGPFRAPHDVPADAPVYPVARLLPADAKAGTAFDSVAAACAAIPEGTWGIVEINDNGPLFEAPVRVSGRNVVVRGGRGYAPLLVWDPARARAELKPAKPGDAGPKDNGPAFLSVEKGTLLLDNIHLAVGWPESVAGTGCLVRVAGGDLVAHQTTFSLAGKPQGALAAVRFEGGAGRTCRLTHCVARGARLTALDVPAAGAEVLIDKSLLVTTEAPLLSAAGGAAGVASTLRVVRSTLVGRDTVLRVGPAAGSAADPALHWLGWDALLVRAAENPGGTMVDLPKGAGHAMMTWRSVNSLYAGWDTLLSGREPVAGGNEEGWHTAWKRIEGDRSLPEKWVKSMPADPAEVLPIAYNTGPGPLRYAATYDAPGLLGCDLDRLPWCRPRWIDLSAERARLTEAEALTAPLAIPEANDLLYHGERLDLDKIDLGAYLRGVQEKQKLAPLVVLWLHGTGTRKSKPVRVEGSNLFLYFEPPAEGAEPLVLEPDLSDAPDASAFLQVTRGNLAVLDGDVRCPDFKVALLPKYLVLVRDGTLWLTRTRLQGPLAQPPPGYWGLVRVEGTGLALRGNMFLVSINQCALLSAKIVLHLACAGLRADLRQSLLLSTDRAVVLQTALPSQKEVPGYPSLDGSPNAAHGLFGVAFMNFEVSADHCTFAAREAAFHLDDVPVRSFPPYVWPVMADPIVVQTKDCAFLNPFEDKDGKAAAALLTYSGAALPRGLLCWQGQGNVYDKRLHTFVTPLGKGADNMPKPVRPEKPQSFAAWERLWGPGESKPLPDVEAKGTLDLAKLAPEQLALPPLKEKPGADVAKLLAPRKK